MNMKFILLDTMYYCINSIMKVTVTFNQSFEASATLSLTLVFTNTTIKAL
jgi:hypothetical protein